MKLRIAVIPGDGVGPEILFPALRVLRAAAQKYGHALELTQVLACGRALEETGEALPERSLNQCLEADAVLLGNVGLARYRNAPPDKRPEAALLRLRRELGVTTNIRPVRLYPALAGLSPLRPEIAGRGFDFVFVRDIVGGVLCSRKVTEEGRYGPQAYEYEYYNQRIVADTAQIAFRLAEGRKKRVASFDKSNVLESSRLWRRTVTKLSAQHPQIALSHSYIDAAAMKIIRSPQDFDVIVTSNLFGDIISDEGTELTGTPGLYGSAEIRASGKGLYTPNQLHAPEGNAGKGLISPVGMIAAAALMLRYTFGLNEEAADVERAIDEILKQGYVTEDMNCTGTRTVSTEQMGRLVAERIRQ